MNDEHQFDRRGFLRTGAVAGIATSAGLVSSRAVANSPTAGDIAILQFLCAAEQIETDLWEQYKEMGEGNPEYAEALQKVLDKNVVTYTADTTADERSHDKFIAAYLQSIGITPVDLKPFRTIPSPNIEGGQGRFRLTNLTSLSIDTSYYKRYHNHKNPDLGDDPGQIATIVNQPAIPTKPKVSNKELLGLAGVAGLHFASIEQGGSSLYNTLLLQISSVQVLHIAASIYATEAIHFAIFNDILGNYPGFDNGEGSLLIPDLRNGNHNSDHVMATPCKFLSDNLPNCSVIRPGTPQNSGAVAAATALVKSNLFKGQSQAFFNAVVALASAADAAKRVA